MPLPAAQVSAPSTQGESVVQVSPIFATETVTIIEPLGQSATINTRLNRDHHRAQETLGGRKIGLSEPRVDPQEFVYAPALFSTVRCSLRTGCHQPDIPLTRCSPNLKFPQTDIP